MFGALALPDALGLFEVQDLRAWDLLLRLRGTRTADDRIALVDIDDATVQAYDRWPLRRDVYALLITALEDAGVRALGFDLLFLDQDRDQPASDRLLAAVTGRYDNVVHAVAPNRTPVAGAAAPPRSVVHEEAPVPAPPAEALSLPFPELQAACRAQGHVSVLLDRDGAVRRVPLLVRSGGRLHADLAMRVVGLAAGWPDPPRVRPASGAVEIATGDDEWMRVPVDRQGGTSFDFAGGPSAFPRRYPLIEVLRWIRGGRTDDLRAAFADRIVFVGVIATEAAIVDIAPTPFGGATALVYAHANLADALLNDRLLRDVPRGGFLAAAGLLAAILGGTLLILPLAGAAITAATMTLVLAAADFLALTRLGLRIPPTVTILLAPSLFLAVVVYRFAFLERSLREWNPVLRLLRSFGSGSPTASESDGQSGVRRIGAYELGRLVGRGGMGEVWLAHHRLLNRSAAVKLIRRERLGTQDAGQVFATLKRFEREVQATASLNSPHTVDIYDFGVDRQGNFYYVMELLEGLSLDTLVRNFGPVPPERAVHLLLQVCESLEEAHQAGLIHRDVKPANIFVARAGTEVDHVKVLDFGLVKRQQDDTGGTALTVEGSVSGTPAFMAPEQALGHEDLDARADLYAVGCVAYWLLTGHTVFEGRGATEQLTMHARDLPTAPSSRTELPVPGDLERAVMRCLEKDVRNRPVSAAALASELGCCECAGAWTVTRAQSWWDIHYPEGPSAWPAPAKERDLDATRPLRALPASPGETAPDDPTQPGR